MRKIILKILVSLLVFACFPLFAENAVAQEASKEKQTKETVAEKQPKPVSAYRLEFSLREMEEGERVNARSYAMLVEEDNWGRIRVGSKVPITTGEKQIQYMDVGVNIDCRVRERENYLLLDTTIEMTSFVSPEGASGVAGNPVLRHLRSQVATAIPLAKPALISIADDTATKHRYEVEVTAVKSK